MKRCQIKQTKYERGSGPDSLRLTKTLSSDVDLNGDVNVDSIVDLGVDCWTMNQDFSLTMVKPRSMSSSTMESTSTSPSTSTMWVNVEVQVYDPSRLLTWLPHTRQFLSRR